MLKTRTILLACSLLLVPTLLLGLGAFELLSQQQQTLLNRSQATASDRALAIAGNIDLAIGEVQDGLLLTLGQFPQENLVEALENWKRNNPLVRNVFIWDSSAGLIHPQRAPSEEAAAFTRRYQSLFSNQSSWSTPKADQPPPLPSTANNDLYTSRQKLRSLATEAPATIVAESSADSLAAGESGWRHWFADNRLQLLGWYQPAGSSQRIGLELEMMALLGRLLNNIPGDPAEGESYQLLDGNAEIFHQTGAVDDSKAPSVHLASVGLQSLPHWQIRIISNKSQTATGPAGFLLIAGLLVASFMVCILAGGGLLLWQAWRNSREARQKTGFVSNVSHELKTPLTTIRMYAEMISEQTNLDERTGNYLQVIVKESQRLTRLVNNVLDFSRLEQGEKAYQKIPLDLLDLLQQLLKQQQLRFSEVGMQLQLQLPESPVLISSDRDALEQIILNLLDNAIKYAAEGKQLQIQLQYLDANWQLSCCDRGPGIATDQLTKVFEKFHRIDDRLNAPQQGTGLGLSIARQLALGLGGDLSCENRQTGGACFTLTLPTGGSE